MPNSLFPRRRILLQTAGCVIAVLALSVEHSSAFGQVVQQSPNSQTSSQGTEARQIPNANSVNSVLSVPEDFASLKLAPGFLLNIQVYDEPDFSGPFRVDNTGNIHLPFLKALHVADDTVFEAKEKIEKAFQDQGILKHPELSIDVQQFATTTATVIGEVQNPGKVELLAPHSLLDVIGMTGGETPFAGNEVELKRAHPEGEAAISTYHYSRGGDTASIRDVMVRPGDTVMVKRTGIVYVLGAVNKPGGYAMQEEGELNVAQAISLAQGLSLQAKVGSLRVVQHRSDGQLVEIPIPYKKIMDGKEQPMNLAAGDIVYVPVSKVKSVLGSTVGLIGQTTAAAIYVH